MGCKGRWELGFKPRPGSHRKKRPRGSKVNGEDHKVLGERRVDHAAPKKIGGHTVLE